VRLKLHLKVPFVQIEHSEVYDVDQKVEPALKFVPLVIDKHLSFLRAKVNRNKDYEVQGLKRVENDVFDYVLHFKLGTLVPSETRLLITHQFINNINRASVSKDDALNQQRINKAYAFLERVFECHSYEAKPK
jgi:hypothetical protein